MSEKRERPARQTSALLQEQVPGLSRRQVDYWCEKGFVKPTYNGGQGMPRSFTGTELKVMKVLYRLTLAGFPVGVAAEIARRAVTNAVNGKAEVKLSHEPDAIMLCIEGV